MYKKHAASSILLCFSILSLISVWLTMWGILVPAKYEASTIEGFIIFGSISSFLALIVFAIENDYQGGEF